jgi:peptide/nickel transport system ATP-binding protein/oligopeptide transport system ATP-binding protein
MNDEVLRVTNLSRHFIIKPTILGPQSIIHAVKGVSFGIRRNETLGLIGKSGCGKTTTAMLILRLLQPSEGNITLFGQDITHYPENEMRPLRKHIQMVFQHTKAVLDPKMTIDELVREALRIHQVVPKEQMDDEIRRILGLVGLPRDEGWKLPGQLSGGQYQRMIIARAIAPRPRLIICDEPVSALDVSVQGQILNLLVDLKQELGLSYLVISHDLRIIRHMCNRVAVMDKGEIISSGTAGELLGQGSLPPMV